MLTPIELKLKKCEGRTIEVTPDVRLPSTPARETSEFFDSINNLDPIKFSPPSRSEHKGQRNMHPET